MKVKDDYLHPIRREVIEGLEEVVETRPLFLDTSGGKDRFYLCESDLLFALPELGKIEGYSTDNTQCLQGHGQGLNASTV